MIKVDTKFPVAYTSLDHIHPEGIYWDNNLNLNFIEQLESFWGDRKIRFMDVGCAGGEMVCEMHRRGHTSVGLEGSDQCLNVRNEMVEEVGREPLGKNNWQEYGNKILFTCDVTKPFTVFNDDEPMKFDVVTCFDVIEHFDPEDQSQFIQNIRKHLKDDGIFLLAIAMFPAGRSVGHDPIEYHKSIFPVEWWQNKFQENDMLEFPYPFNTTNRSYQSVQANAPIGTTITHGPTYICLWKKKL